MLDGVTDSSAGPSSPSSSDLPLEVYDSNRLRISILTYRWRHSHRYPSYEEWSHVSVLERNLATAKSRKSIRSTVLLVQWSYSDIHVVRCIGGSHSPGTRSTRWGRRRRKGQIKLSSCLLVDTYVQNLSMKTNRWHTTVPVTNESRSLFHSIHLLIRRICPPDEIDLEYADVSLDYLNERHWSNERDQRSTTNGFLAESSASLWGHIASRERFLPAWNGYEIIGWKQEWRKQMNTLTETFFSLDLPIRRANLGRCSSVHRRKRVSGMSHSMVWRFLISVVWHSSSWIYSRNCQNSSCS